MEDTVEIFKNSVILSYKLENMYENKDTEYLNNLEIKNNNLIKILDDSYNKYLLDFQSTHKNVKEEDILQYCFQKLPFSKAPKCIVFTDKLPVTSTGKYQRNKAKPLFAQYQGKQFKKI